jgi:enoyl-CoA hydratase
VAIHYDRADEHVVLVTIDRPEARNALDRYHFRDLARAWERFRDEDDAWVAVVTGVGDAFCAGADLKTYIPWVISLQERAARGEDPEEDGCRLSDGVKAVLRDFPLYKPVVAAVNGPCVAGGMEMLGGADIRLAAPEAVFGVLEPKRGLFAGGGTTARLPRQVPFAAAMEFLLVAAPVSAERALALGLLNEIVPRERLLDRALEWARRIAANGPLAVRATKESVLRGLSGTLEEAYRIERELSAKVFRSEDAKEGARAFAEKRPPNWRNR